MLAFLLMNRQPKRTPKQESEMLRVIVDEREKLSLVPDELLS